ncbi:MAG: signal peptidase I [Anaerolinea sp.]|nr:signal peptidase I [Anaerolinea sp.]MCC6973261.1 signal peptidase I [Anaerolineae bacterium]
MTDGIKFETPAPEPEEHTFRPSERPRLRAHRRLVRDVIEIVLLIVITYTPINLMTARAVVEGPSMKPNFETGDLVIVNRSAYFFGAPQRGDVVVLHNPRNSTSDDLIKRIIGLPSETIEIREGRVYANGTLLEEPYVNNFCTCSGMWILKDDEYFILGDNRSNSFDSHNFGPINKNLIVGQAWIRYYPLSKFTIIAHPRYPTVDPNYVPPTPTPTPQVTPMLPGAPSYPPALTPRDNLNPRGGV